MRLFAAILLLESIKHAHSIPVDIDISHIAEHPEILDRMKSSSNCSDQHLALVNAKCAELVKNLIYVVHDYEHGLRHHNEDIHSLTPCERSQVACFSHPAWLEAANCVCSVCNHIWLYDEYLHDRFVLYFENDHDCAGTIPNRMWKMDFCDFMRHPSRKILPNACRQGNSSTPSTFINDEHDDDYVYFEGDFTFGGGQETQQDSATSSTFLTNHALMIWSLVLAIAMSISMYFYTR